MRWGCEGVVETPSVPVIASLVLTPGGVMIDYATLLRDHVRLTCRSIDRIFLQAYVPKLQTVGWVCNFLRWQRGFHFPRLRHSGRSARHTWLRCTSSPNGTAPR